jgi:hypothetical protein
LHGRHGRELFFPATPGRVFLTTTIKSQTLFYERKPVMSNNQHHAFHDVSPAELSTVEGGGIRSTFMFIGIGIGNLIGGDAGGAVGAGIGSALGGIVESVVNVLT